MARTETTYNLIIGTSGDDIYVLDGTFEYGDGFKGATGSIIRPVPQEEIDRALEDEEIEDYHRDLWVEAVKAGTTEDSLSEWVEDLDRDEYLDHRFESYDDIEAEDIAATVGIEVPARFELHGLGRIWSRERLESLDLIDSDEVRAAIEQIRLYEAA